MRTVLCRMIIGIQVKFGRSNSLRRGLYPCATALEVIMIIVIVVIVVLVVVAVSSSSSLSRKGLYPGATTPVVVVIIVVKVVLIVVAVFIVGEGYIRVLASIPRPLNPCQ